MTTYLTPAEASAWFEAALEALSDPADLDCWGWVLDASRGVACGPALRGRLIKDLDHAARHNEWFNTPESRRDARVLCFCATVLRALEVKR